MLGPSGGLLPLLGSNIVCELSCSSSHVQDSGCSRDPERTPLQWDTSANAGFTSATAQPWLPLNPNYLQGVNVEQQMEAADSHLQV